MAGATSWKCTKCGNSTVSTNKPLITGCWKGGNHSWTRVAAPGGVATWRCGKCGNSITNGSTKPMSRPCSRGGNCSWSRQR